MTSIVMDRYRYCPPTAADFPTVIGTNSENPTLTNTTGRGLNISFGTNPAGSGENLRGCFKNLNAASNQSIIARFDFCQWGFEFSSGGLAITDGTKFITWGQGWRGTPGLFLDEFTNNTTFSGVVLETGSNSGDSGKSSLGNMEWMRIDLVSGIPTKFYLSSNGTDWIMLYDSSLSGFMSSPTKVGFYMDMDLSSGNTPVSGTEVAYLNVLYYSDPDITPPV